MKKLHFLIFCISIKSTKKLKNKKSIFFLLAKFVHWVKLGLHTLSRKIRYGKELDFFAAFVIFRITSFFAPESFVTACYTTHDLLLISFANTIFC